MKKGIICNLEGVASTEIVIDLSEGNDTRVSLKDTCSVKVSEPISAVKLVEHED